MKYSKTAIKELTARYRTVLLHATLVGAIAMLGLTAQAADDLNEVGGVYRVAGVDETNTPNGQVVKVATAATVEDIRTDLGDPVYLYTNDKSSLVGGVNEVFTKVNEVDAVNQSQDTAITDLQAGLGAATDRVTALENAVMTGENLTETKERVSTLEGSVDQLAKTDDILSEQISQKADKSALETLSSTVDTKADKSAVSDLTNTVNTLSESVDTKADKADLTALSAKVDTKADKTDLTALSTKVDTKADKADLNKLEQDIQDKADKSDLTDLSNTVGTNNFEGTEYASTRTDSTITGAIKAVDTALGETNDKVEALENSKADTTYVDAKNESQDAEIALKANQADVDAKNESQDAEIALKANQADVDAKNESQDAEIALKANQADVDAKNESQDAEIALKANQADVDAKNESQDAEIALKANQADVDAKNESQDAEIALKADKTYVDSELARTNDELAKTNATIGAGAVTGTAGTLDGKTIGSDTAAGDITVTQAIGTLNATNNAQNTALGVLNTSDGTYKSDVLVGNGFVAGKGSLAESLTSYAANNAAALGGSFNDAGTWAGTVTAGAAVNYGETTHNSVLNAVNQVASNIGTAVQGTNGNVVATNTVNQNLDLIDSKIGDLATLKTENKNLTNGTATAPTTIVEALNNVDATLGTIHGLADKLGDAHQGNLASGTTVEDHLTAVDAAIGNRAEVNSANAQINEAAKKDVASALRATGNAIGDTNFQSSHYLKKAPDLTSAVRTLDSEVNRLDNQVGRLDKRVTNLDNEMRAGFASVAALTGLVPGSREMGDTQISLGTGMYQDRVGFALGAYHYVNDNVLLNAGASYGGTESTIVKGGVTFGW